MTGTPSVVKPNKPQPRPGLVEPGSEGLRTGVAPAGANTGHSTLTAGKPNKPRCAQARPTSDRWKIDSTLLERTDAPWRCWCSADDCDDRRHCACGFADCAGHRVWGTE